MTRTSAARHAGRDLRAAAAWIAKDSAIAAESFLLAFDVAARLLGEHPHMGRRRPELGSDRYRFWSLRGFPYILVYDANMRPPRIVRILHISRAIPAEWADLHD